MAPPVPAAVPGAPCPELTIEQCAALANWQAVEAARATARWIELTLYAEIFGGLAAIVAAGFAGAAFVMSRRAAKASEKQARAAEEQLDLERKKHDNERDAQARTIRPRLKFRAPPRGRVMAHENKANVTIRIENAGPGVALTLVASARLEWIDTDDQKYEGEWRSLGNSTSLQTEQIMSRAVELPIDGAAIAAQGNTWLDGILRLQISWRDESDYEIGEEWEFRQPILDNTLLDFDDAVMLFRDTNYAPYNTEEEE